jgi:Carboxypeptidase regulatory-like domain
MSKSWRMLVSMLAAGLALTAIAAAPSRAANFGALSGIVLDGAGTPQMGASVTLVAETTGAPLDVKLFTNQKGVFSNSRVPPGWYEVRVTLAGFLPSVQRHVRVIANLSTLVKVELTTMFTSLDRLRNAPGSSAATSDDWKWVARASPATRTILQILDDNVAIASSSADAPADHPTKAQIELTGGSENPGSISNLPNAPASAFAYDQSLGAMGRLMLAAEMSYGRQISAPALALIWTPLGNDAQTTVMVRQTPLGPAGFTFTGVRVGQHNSAQLGDRVSFHYGTEVEAASLGRTTEALRPNAGLDLHLTPGWTANVFVASETNTQAPLPTGALDSAINELDSFPVLLVRDGRPRLEAQWHMEAGIERKLGQRSTVEAAAYHDRSADTAVFGRGTIDNPDFLNDPTSDAFAYDAGSFDSWGMRAAYRQKLSNDFALAAVYAYAGVLAPGDADLSEPIRDTLKMHYRHSVALRFSGRIQRTRTQFGASYKWIDGQALTRQDAYGETAYNLDPYLSFDFRQDLPVNLWSGRWQAVAEVRNLLAQGYAIVASQDGPVLLTPACRSFRGGLSFQF